MRGKLVGKKYETYFSKKLNRDTFADRLYFTFEKKDIQGIGVKEYFCSETSGLDVSSLVIGENYLVSENRFGGVDEIVPLSTGSATK